MATGKPAEDRLMRPLIAAGFLSLAAMIGLGFTALRGPGTGPVLVLAAAGVLAAGMVVALVYRRRRRRSWPGARLTRR